VPEGGGAPGGASGAGIIEEGIEHDQEEEAQEERINQSTLGVDDDISSVCTDVLLNLR